MSKKLKPCPFCGGSATAFQSDHGFFIFCKNPECSILPRSSFYPTIAEAITGWNNRNEADEQLKPCPFCGGKAEISENPTASDGWVKCICTNCHASTEVFTAGERNALLKKVIRLWNRRIIDE